MHWLTAIIVNIFYRSLYNIINFFTTISIVTRNAMIETTVTTGKSGKTLPNKFFGTLLTLIGSNKDSVNGFARKYS